MENKSTLHRLLSQAFNIPLVECGSTGDLIVKVVDDSNFILTVDFLMKLLGIHERVECRLPCIIEGETGVSKTALANMYSQLRNTAVRTAMQNESVCDLEALCEALVVDGFSESVVEGTASLDRICTLLTERTDEILHRTVRDFVKERVSERSVMFESCPYGSAVSSSVEEDDVIAFVRWFARASLKRTFFEINVDSSLSEVFFVDRFAEICATASEVASVGASVIVFLDGKQVVNEYGLRSNCLFQEINTSSVLGLLKEIVVDRSICGSPLPENLVLLAACNPYRSQIQSATRERDLGKSWVSGHYQVLALPESMERLKWSFGALSHSKEKEFICRKVERTRFAQRSPSFVSSMAELISRCHELMRVFARRNILSTLGQDSKESQQLVEERSSAVVSLRDIQRVFSLFDFFIDFLVEHLGKGRPEDSVVRRKAMLLSVAVVYYMRLDEPSRREFEREVEQFMRESNYPEGLESTLEEAMGIVQNNTDTSDGIAATRGLRENLFVVLVCSLSRTPLMIVGPPGTSKVCPQLHQEEETHCFSRHFRHYQ